MPKTIKFTFGEDEMDSMVAAWPDGNTDGKFVKRGDNYEQGKTPYSELVPKAFEEKYGVRLSNKNSAKFHKGKVTMYFT